MAASASTSWSSFMGLSPPHSIGWSARNTHWLSPDGVGIALPARVYAVTASPALETMPREAGADARYSVDALGGEPGLPGAGHVGVVVVEIEDLAGRTLQAGGQTAEGLRVRLAPA